MNNPILITLAALFYLLLAIGAVARFKRSRKLSTSMQLLGVFLPILPGLAIIKFGYSNTLAIAYCLLWMLMGVGYILESMDQKKLEVR